jgi:hypothetical protein
LTVRCQDYGKEYESTKKFSSGLKHFYTILKSHKKKFSYQYTQTRQVLIYFTSRYIFSPASSIIKFIELSYIFQFIFIINSCQSICMTPA